MNYSIYSKLICDAAQSGCRIAFLPEAFDFIGRNKNETFELAENINGEIISNMKKLAKDSNIWLSLGGFHRVRNRFYIFLRRIGLLLNVHILKVEFKIGF